MRRSPIVIAPILASVAAALTGCHTSEPQRCVDEQNHVVDPSFCKNLPPNAQQPVAGSLSNGGGYYNNGIFFPHFYRFYYGGGGGFAPGAIVSGGAYAPLSGHSYSLGGTTRGGFGSSFGGGEGGGGE